MECLEGFINWGLLIGPPKPNPPETLEIFFYKGNIRLRILYFPGYVEGTHSLCEVPEDDPWDDGKSR